MLGVIGAIAGGLGGLLGGKAQADAADAAAGVQRDMFNRMDELAKEGYRLNEADILKGDKRVQNYLRANYQSQADQAAKLRNFGHKQATGLRDRNAREFGTARDASFRANNQTLRQNLNLADNTYRRGLGFAGDAMDAGLKNAAATKQQNIAEFAAARDAGLKNASATKRQNIAGFNEAMDAGLGEFQPALNLGTNALRAYASNLGVGKAPAGYSMELTPGAKFLMEQGRDITEGGAAGGGNLYSGATLEALEKQRMGLAATDRDTQMAQLMTLGGVGMNAANARAGIRSDYTGRIADERSDALATGIGLRDRAATKIAGERSDALATGNALRDKYASRGIALNDDRAGAITDARNLALSTGNNIRGSYADRIAGMNTDAFKNNLAIETDWRNSNNALRNAFNTGQINATNSLTDRLTGARDNRVSLASGQARNYASSMVPIYGGMGNAGANMWGSIANGLNSGLSNWAFNSGMGGGTPGFTPPAGWSTPSMPSWLK